MISIPEFFPKLQTFLRYLMLTTITKFLISPQKLSIPSYLSRNFLHLGIQQMLHSSCTGQKTTSLGTCFVCLCGYSKLTFRLSTNPADSNFKMQSKSRTLTATVPPWPSQYLPTDLLIFPLAPLHSIFNSDTRVILMNLRHGSLFLCSNPFNAFLTLSEWKLKLLK